MQSTSHVSGTEVSKEAIRKQVWDYLEKHNLALFPRPVHGRIPNFKGCEAAAQKLAQMDIFRQSSLIKVGPDKPQEGVRRLGLQLNKQILMPIPRLRSGLFVRLEPNRLPRDKIKYAATAKGAKEFGTPVGLDAVLPINIVVMGSVAVSSQGFRIGKGEGFADLEYGILKEMGTIDDSVPIITTVHDCQVLDELPSELFKEHDMPVDIIVTPTRVIHTSAKTMSIPRPAGILWELLTPKRIADMPVLRILRERLLTQGKCCPMKATSKFRVKISNFPRETRVREIKDVLFAHNVKPSYMTWDRDSRHAVLHYNEYDDSRNNKVVSEVVSVLQKIKIGGSDLIVSLLSEK